MIPIDTDSYKGVGQKYGWPSPKCGMSATYKPTCQAASEYLSMLSSGTQFTDLPLFHNFMVKLPQLFDACEM